MRYLRHAAFIDVVPNVRNNVDERSFRRWLSQATTCMMPQRKAKDMCGVGGVGREVELELRYEMSVMLSQWTAIVTESAGAARFDHRHLLRQNCRTQRRRKRASNLRNFESHLKCSPTASAYLISTKNLSTSIPAVFSVNERSFGRWLSQSTTCGMIPKKSKRHVAEWAEWDEQLSSR
jgi:hypothetical protein